MERIRSSGGYRTLRAFQVTTLIYDATYWFCEAFLPSRSRMIDQMVQAARSGRQNIAEGSRAGTTSSQSELLLVNVARASLDELLLDYEDFLRQRGQSCWEKDDPEAMVVRRIATDNKATWNAMSDLQRFKLYGSWLESSDPFVRANAIVCLIHQANYLLDHQLTALEKRFIEEGGYREQMAAARLGYRNEKRDSAEPNVEQLPDCPDCGRSMVSRTAKAGPKTGQPFLGCSNYPECRGTRSL
jgi:restriction system protein